MKKFLPTSPEEYCWRNSSPAGLFEFLMYRAWQIHQEYFKAGQQTRNAQLEKYDSIMGNRRIRYPPFHKITSKEWIPRLDDIIIECKQEGIVWPIVANMLALWDRAREQRWIEAADHNHDRKSQMLDQALFYKKYGQLTVDKLWDRAKEFFHVSDFEKKTFLTRKFLRVFYPLDPNEWYTMKIRDPETRKTVTLEWGKEKAWRRAGRPRPLDMPDLIHLKRVEGTKYRNELYDDYQLRLQKAEERRKAAATLKAEREAQALAAAGAGPSGMSSGKKKAALREDPTVRVPTKPAKPAIQSIKVDLSKIEMMYSKKPVEGKAKDLETNINPNLEPYGCEEATLIAMKGDRITFTAVLDDKGRVQELVVVLYNAEVPAFGSVPELTAALTPIKGKKDGKSK